MSDLAYVAICDDAQCGKCYKCKNAELEAERDAQALMLEAECAAKAEARAKVERLDKMVKFAHDNSDVRLHTWWQEQRVALEGKQDG